MKRINAVLADLRHELVAQIDDEELQVASSVLERLQAALLDKIGER